ncbi:MAG: STAS-like domain-containing protein [Xylophilus ampelinus]
MNAITIVIAKDFSPTPAGRYYPEDGDYPGQRFREELLYPALIKNTIVTVDLDGTSGYGSSFLEEAFGGLIRAGLQEKVLKMRMKVKSNRPSYETRIWDYIHKASVKA